MSCKSVSQLHTKGFIFMLELSTSSAIYTFVATSWFVKKFGFVPLKQFYCIMCFVYAVFLWAFLYLLVYWNTYSLFFIFLFNTSYFFLTLGTHFQQPFQTGYNPFHVQMIHKEITSAQIFSHKRVRRLSFVGFKELIASCFLES